MSKEKFMQNLRKLGACSVVLYKLKTYWVWETTEDLYKIMSAPHLMWLISRVDSFENIYALLKIWLAPVEDSDDLYRSCFQIAFNENLSYMERSQKLKNLTNKYLDDDNRIWKELIDVYDLILPPEDVQEDVETNRIDMASYIAWLLHWKNFDNLRDYYPHDEILKLMETYVDSM